MAMMIDVFTNEQINHIATIAANSDIYDYDWENQGRAPNGYTEGMALTWAQCYVKWKRGDKGMQICAEANSGHSDSDVLSWYRGIFDKAGMPNQVAGSDTLRHLFVLMLGLGMRESSGEHCCGKDPGASNTTSDTCEAGMFQTSWNINTCSSEIPAILAVWETGDFPQCYEGVFAKQVSCSAANWQSYGSGIGKKYQDISKKCPPCHAEITAVGLRKRRNHWGPINRYEAEVRPEADEMFKEVQLYVDTWDQVEPPPEDVATIEIKTTGNVRVVINGTEII